MKNILLLLAAVALLSACHKEDCSDSEDRLLGTWELVEVLADPGDGSGTFQPVDSDKTVTFKRNNVITSNGDLCSLAQDIGTPTSGTYSLTDGTYTASSCANSNWVHRFEQQGNVLIIFHPCIEACQTKYVKQ